MRDDVIDIVNAEDVEVGDYIEYGEVYKVEENPADSDYINIYADSSDEPITYRWDHMVKLYGDLSVDV